MVTDIKTETYYTPEIQDLRVGYECELNSYSKGYTPFTFNTMTELAMWATPHQLSKETVRTKFLTREQLEAEGWIFNTQVTDVTVRFVKGGYLLVFNTSNRRVRISDFADQLIDLKINSINEFRMICKLLKID